MRYCEHKGHDQIRYGLKLNVQLYIDSILYPSTQKIHHIQELLPAFVRLQKHTDCLLPAQIHKHIARPATRRTESIDGPSATRGLLNDYIRRQPASR